MAFLTKCAFQISDACVMGGRGVHFTLDLRTKSRLAPDGGAVFDARRHFLLEFWCRAMEILSVFHSRD